MTAVSTAVRPAGTATVSTTTSMTTFGSLAWAGWVWALAVLGSGIALAAVVRWGSMTESLWSSTFAGWQHWPMGGMGVSMVTVFVPMLVPNGVTRNRVAQGAAVTMMIFSLAVAAVITVGFAVEARVYDAQDWTQHLGEGGRTAAEVGYPMIFVGHALLLSIVFAGGWFVGAALFRAGWAAVVPAVLVALVPLVVLETLVLQVVGLGQFDFLERFSPDGYAVGLVVCVVLLVVETVAAVRITRAVDVD